LEVAGALREEAKKDLKRAEEKHEEAREKVTIAEQKLRDTKVTEPSDNELRLILKKNLKDALEGTDSETVAKLLESAGEWSGRDEFNEAAQRLRSGQSTVEQSRAVFEEARALYSRADFWLGVLSRAKLHKTWQFWAFVIVLLAIPAIALAAGTRQEWVHLWAAIGEIITITGGIVAWSKSSLARASTVFNHLSSVEGKLARSIDEARSRDRKAYELARDTAQAGEKQALAELEAAQRAELKAAEEERGAREALGDSTSQARLGRFIRERASSADYEKHLGLIAMIHRDFERLSELMEKAQRAKSESSLPATQDDSGFPRIDRIILYIDDLDRCYPPEKVVKVLEAVHLLLFFPLFVVVVGVNSRWLSRSLHEHYRGMLADEAIIEDGEAPAGSKDFLEKIFQVPFWLRRMDPEAVRALVHSLISAEERTVSAPIGMNGHPATTPAAVEPIKEEGENRAVNLGPAKDDPGIAAAKRTAQEAEISKSAIGEFEDAPSESLTITEAELAFMDKVSSLMPRTPRSVKRFVNIYRLYKAALSPLALANFVGTSNRPGNFRAVQVLLALVTGSPLLAQEVFKELKQCESKSDKRLSDLIMNGASGRAWETTVNALRKFAQEEDCNLPLQALKDVSGLVARYSLHNMVIQAPGEAGLG
jgi:hypothetical protein